MGLKMSQKRVRIIYSIYMPLFWLLYRNRMETEGTIKALNRCMVITKCTVLHAAFQLLCWS